MLMSAQWLGGSCKLTASVVKLQCPLAKQLIGPKPYICRETAIFSLALDRSKTHLLPPFELPWIGPKSLVISALTRWSTWEYHHGCWHRTLSPFMLCWWRTKFT